MATRLMQHSRYFGVALFMALVASFSMASAAKPAAKTASVTIVEPPFQSPMTWHYQSSTIKVRTGTTVTWTNSGAVLHTVTATNHKSFDSKDMLPQRRFSFTFNKPGTYSYFCAYHPWMKGTVVVGS